jgi:hypothetical protein
VNNVEAARHLLTVAGELLDCAQDLLDAVGDDAPPVDVRDTMQRIIDETLAGAAGG